MLCRERGEKRRKRNQTYDGGDVRPHFLKGTGAFASEKGGEERKKNISYFLEWSDQCYQKRGENCLRSLNNMGRVNLESNRGKEKEKEKGKGGEVHPLSILLCRLWRGGGKKRRKKGARKKRRKASSSFAFSLFFRRRPLWLREGKRREGGEEGGEVDRHSD